MTANQIDISKVKNILFDIDGTLCAMDNDVFTKEYFRELAKKMIPHGYEAESLTAGVWKGTAAMVTNDGSRTNKEAFWNTFASVLGEKVLKDETIFDEFYRNEFNDVKRILTPNPDIPEFVGKCRDKGYRLFIASNPLFPMIAQRSRIGWAKLDPDSFEYITSYENSHYCKPNPKYFAEIADVCDIKPDECLVIGNDAKEDTAALDTGMQVFIVTDWLINKENRNIDDYAHGSWKDLLNMI